jgi:uncharacterized membrane protein YeaQ/YmgE (transglycosylase-associated protein family)
MLFADLAFHPGGIASWLVVGLTVGWLAGKVMENPSYGIIGDLLLGSIGAVIGGASLGFFVTGEPDFWLGALTALMGACPVVVAGRIVVAQMNA